MTKEEADKTLDAALRHLQAVQRAFDDDRLNNNGRMRWKLSPLLKEAADAARAAERVSRETK